MERAIDTPKRKKWEKMFTYNYNLDENQVVL